MHFTIICNVLIWKKKSYKKQISKVYNRKISLSLNLKYPLLYTHVLCLFMQWQTSWRACCIAADITQVSNRFMHRLSVDLQISLQGGLVITLGALVSHSSVLILFVLFQSIQWSQIWIALITIIFNTFMFIEKVLCKCFSLKMAKGTFLEFSMLVLHMWFYTRFASTERAQDTNLMLFMLPLIVSFQIAFCSCLISTLLTCYQVFPCIVHFGHMSTQLRSKATTVITFIAMVWFFISAVVTFPMMPQYWRLVSFILTYTTFQFSFSMFQSLVGNNSSFPICHPCLKVTTITLEFFSSVFITHMVLEGLSCSIFSITLNTLETYHLVFSSMVFVESILAFIFQLTLVTFKFHHKNKFLLFTGICGSKSLKESFLYQKQNWNHYLEILITCGLHSCPYFNIDLFLEKWKWNGSEGVTILVLHEIIWI